MANELPRPGMSFLEAMPFGIAGEAMEAHKLISAIGRFWQYAEHFHTAIFMVTLCHDATGIDLRGLVQDPALHTILLVSILVAIILTYRHSGQTRREMLEEVRRRTRPRASDKRRRSAPRRKDGDTPRVTTSVPTRVANRKATDPSDSADRRKRKVIGDLSSRACEYVRADIR